MTLAPDRDDTAAAALAERLRDPAVVASLNTLVDHADLLAIMVVALDGFIARSEVIGDSLVSSVTELRGTVEGSGFDASALVEAGRTLAETLPKAAPSLVALVESGSLEQLATLTAGLADGARTFETHPVDIGGPLSLLRLLKDPDINRTISWAATIARSLGRELDHPSTPTTSK